MAAPVFAAAIPDDPDSDPIVNPDGTIVAAPAPGPAPDTPILAPAAAAPADPDKDPIVPPHQEPAAPASGFLSGFWSNPAYHRPATFATGANDFLATAAGLPVDLAAFVARRMPALSVPLPNAPAEPQLKVPDEPFGGSASIRNALTAAIGRTDPQDAFDRVLAGTGAGVASVPTLGLAAAAPRAAGVLGEEFLPWLRSKLPGGSPPPPAAPPPAAPPPAAPPPAAPPPAPLSTLSTRADALLAPATRPALARAATIAGGGGAGGSAAREEVRKVTDNPWALAAADLVGGGLGSLAATLPMAGARLIAQLLRPMTAGGQQTLVGRQLDQAATGNRATPGKPLASGQSYVGPLTAKLADTPPAGISPTLGDLTNNQGLQTIQRTVETLSPEAGTAAQTIASQNNQAIHRTFDEVGQPGVRTPEQISEAGAKRLTDVHDDQHSQASDAFARLDNPMVPVTPIQDRYDNFMTGLEAARRDFVPDRYGKLLAGYEDEEPLNELQAFASTLKTDARAANRTGNYNQANVLGDLRDALFPEGGPEALLAPQHGQTAADARAALQGWRQYRETYTDPPAINGVLRGDAPASAAFDKMLASGQGQTERVGQFLKAAQGDPELMQQARDWFSAKMKASGEAAGSDQQGSRFLNGNQLRKFRDANQPLIDSGVFTDQHRQSIDQIVDAANMVQNTARAGARGGSDTVRNLATDRYLGELGMRPLARLIAKAPALVGGPAGAGIGAMLFGPWGAAAGAPIGAALAHSLSYAGARDNLRNLYAQAVHNPDLAATLMERARTRPPTPRGISRQDIAAGTTGTVGGFENGP